MTTAGTKARSDEATEGDVRMSNVECQLVALQSEDFAGDAETIDLVIAPDGEVQSSKGVFVINKSGFLAIEKAFAAHGTDIPVDYEHQTLGGDYAAPDGKAPAAGWIQKLKYEVGRGVVATIAWTARAKEMIRAKEYRYISPVLIVQKADRVAVGLHSVGLTNRPAIVGGLAVAAKDGIGNNLPAGQRKDVPMNELMLIGKDLGLAEADCTVEKITNKIGEVKTKAKGGESATLIANAARTALGLKADAAESEVIMAVNSLKKSQDAVTAMQSELTLIKNKQAEREVDELIAVHGKGKINPNDAVDVKVCRDVAARDPEEFKKWMAARPAIVEGGRTTAAEGGKPGGGDSRETLIANSAKEFDGDASLQKVSKKNEYVNLKLRDAGKPRLSDDEIKKLVG